MVNQKIVHKFLLFLLLSVGLSSCVTSYRINYMQEPDNHIPAYTDTLAYTDYTLRKGDRLYVYVYSLDERITRLFNAGATNGSYMRQMMNSGTNGGYYELYSYLVDENGDMDFPTIGKLHVHGMTTREVKLLLEEKLAGLTAQMEGYKTISCEVNIVQRSFSVIGQQSGRFPIVKEKTTIFEALAMIGEVHEFGDRSCIKIVREVDGHTSIREFDIRSKDIINSEYYYIEPNDIIYIREIPGYSFQVNSAGRALGFVTSFISYGVFVYTIVQTGINHVQTYRGGAE